MKVERIISAEAAAPRFEAAARRIAFRTMLEAIGGVAFVSLAAGWCGWLGGLPALVAAALAVACGTFAALFVAHRKAAILGAAVARPIELIVGHIATSGEDIVSELRSPQGKRLNAGDLARDEALLKERFAEIERRGREAFAQLEEARAKADLQNLAKSQFLAGMSHELRTPLNAVLGYAMLLQEDAKAAGNEAAVADLDRIVLAGRQLLALINDIVELSKLDAGKASVDRSVIDLRALVETVVADFRNDTGEHAPELDVSIAHEAGLMIADMTKIRRCLANLLTYARGAAAGKRIDLVLTVKDTPSTAVFEISNLLIEKGSAEHLFNPLAEAGQAGERRFTGSELSLAVTRRLARLMGGDVVIDGSGAGAALVLSLPMNRPSRSGRTTETPAAPHEIVPVELAGRQERTALVIDDNPAAIDLMQRWLRRLDYEVVAATMGEEGLALAKAQRFDLIILDVFMPDRTGYDILEALRENAASTDTPVILVTVDDDRIQGLDAGATEYMRKPVSEAQLRSMLEIYREPAAGDILVIEDDDDAARLVKRCAEQVGFSTRRAFDGFEGLAMAAANRPSAIVLDLAMPRCDGFDVIERLLADEALASIPVIVLSAGEISFEDHKRIEAAGYRFLTKGVHSPREIAAQLKELIA